VRRRTQLDPSLAVRVLASRPLPYTSDAPAHDDRPAHVRAASGIALHGGRLVVVQDDASFLAVVASDGVSAIKLPRGIDGRRRFEVALGNKLDKLDLESCVAIDDELWAFGSGSLPIREKVCRVRQGVVRVRDAEPLYRLLREAFGGPLNLEGAARVRDELWLFHRGNTGPDDPDRRCSGSRSPRCARGSTRPSACPHRRASMATTWGRSMVRASASPTRSPMAITCSTSRAPSYRPTRSTTAALSAHRSGSSMVTRSAPHRSSDPMVAP